MSELIDWVKSHIEISESELEIIISNFEEIRVSKKLFALKQGQLVKDYFFVKSGVLRIYFQHGEEQITSWIALDNEFFTDLQSLKNKSPSKFNIQALEDTVLLTIKADAMDDLYARFPAWQQFGRQIWELNIIKLIDGIIDFQTHTAEQRYLSLMEKPNLLQRVPLKHLASFLGITKTSLSRLRKKIR